MHPEIAFYGNDKTEHTNALSSVIFSEMFLGPLRNITGPNLSPLQHLKEVGLFHKIE